jgi:hypothetical protein
MRVDSHGAFRPDLGATPNEEAIRPSSLCSLQWRMSNLPNLSNMSNAWKPSAANPSDAVDEGPDSVGGPCTYAEEEGFALITSITEGAPTEANCTVEPREVRFQYFSSRFLPTAVGRITVAGGFNPPESCLRPEGIHCGRLFRVTRMTIVSGTCSPVVYRFRQSFSKCLDQCFQ